MVNEQGRLGYVFALKCKVASQTFFRLHENPVYIENKFITDETLQRRLQALDRLGRICYPAHQPCQDPA